MELCQSYLIGHHRTKCSIRVSDIWVGSLFFCPVFVKQTKHVSATCYTIDNGTVLMRWGKKYFPDSLFTYKNMTDVVYKLHSRRGCVFLFDVAAVAPRYLIYSSKGQPIRRRQTEVWQRSNCHLFVFRNRKCKKWRKDSLKEKSDATWRDAVTGDNCRCVRAQFHLCLRCFLQSFLWLSSQSTGRPSVVSACLWGNGVPALWNSI